MAVQRGRSERRGESYSVTYVEPLSDARTKLADFFSILLVQRIQVAGGAGDIDPGCMKLKESRHEIFSGAGRCRETVGQFKWLAAVMTV